jgi:hypothetical protein
MCPGKHAFSVRQSNSAIAGATRRHLSQFLHPFICFKHRRSSVSTAPLPLFACLLSGKTAQGPTHISTSLLHRCHPDPTTGFSLSASRVSSMRLTLDEKSWRTRRREKGCRRPFSFRSQICTTQRSPRRLPHLPFKHYRSILVLPMKLSDLTWYRTSEPQSVSLQRLITSRSSLSQSHPNNAWPANVAPQIPCLISVSPLALCDEPSGASPDHMAVYHTSHLTCR